jgi:hypothetical protein
MNSLMRLKPREAGRQDAAGASPAPSPAAGAPAPAGGLRPLAQPTSASSSSGASTADLLARMKAAPPKLKLPGAAAGAGVWGGAVGGAAALLPEGRPVSYLAVGPPTHAPRALQASPPPARRTCRPPALRPLLAWRRPLRRRRAFGQVRRPPTHTPRKHASPATPLLAPPAHALTRPHAAADATLPPPSQHPARRWQRATAPASRRQRLQLPQLPASQQRPRRPAAAAPRHASRRRHRRRWWRRRARSCSTSR